MIALADVLPRLKRPRKTRRGWESQCPAHADSTNSLSIAIGNNGRVLLHCFAQCEYRTILAALGLERRASTPSPSRPASPLTEARQQTLHSTQHQAWAKPGVLAMYGVADTIRHARQEAYRLHQAATEAGATEAGWELAELAAQLQTEVLELETALDEKAMHGMPRDPHVAAAWQRVVSFRRKEAAA